MRQLLPQAKIQQLLNVEDIEEVVDTLSLPEVKKNTNRLYSQINQPYENCNSIDKTTDEAFVDIVAKENVQVVQLPYFAD